jgi:hypothetical protein
MCEDCEQGETLMVVYSKKLDRRGWRPPAKAATAPRLRDDASDKANARDKPGARFACERPRRGERRPEVE